VIKCTAAISTAIGAAVIIHQVVEKPAQRVARRALGKTEQLS